MHRSNRTALLIALAFTLGSLGACSSEERTRLADGSLEGTGWLGSADQWGLLGLPLEGGPVTYRRAGTLESPTWAPPELEPLVGAWPSEKAIWVRFPDTRIAQYEYATGHLLTWDSMPVTQQAVAVEGQRQLVIVPDGLALEHVGPLDPWRFELGAPLIRLEDAGDGWVLAVLEGESGVDLVVVEPPADTALGRRQVFGVLDLAITAWGDRLYYLSGDPEDSVVRVLTLPGLEDGEGIGLPRAGSAIAVTPSAHRLYAAAADSIHVFDLLGGRVLTSIAVPDRVTDLRFSITGANLLARLDGAEDRIAVLQVGVDSLLGVVDSEWDADLPVVVPGGRLVARLGTELVLYDASTLAELARSEVGAAQRWFTVEWQPPRPRQETARRPEAPLTVRAMPSRDSDEEAAELDPEAGAPDGFYAVVSAARERAGVDNLVTWLRSVEYPGVVDVHVDPMGVTWYRAMVGPYQDRERAEEAAQSLGARYGYKPWILSISRANDERGNEEQRGGADSGASLMDENTRLRSQGGGDIGDTEV